MEFDIYKNGEQKKGWQNYIVTRPITKKTKRIKMNNGKFKTVTLTEQKFHLAWNGERWANGTDYKRFVAAYSKSHKDVLERIINCEKRNV